MDLPPDKAKLLKQYDNEKKWDIICDQVSNNDESVYDSINRALIYWIFRYIVVERKKYFLSVHFMPNTFDKRIEFLNCRSR